MWTIGLRDGIKFHDGTALDAQVVKNNLDAYRGTYPARHRRSCSALVFGPYIKSVDVVDPLTVNVTVAQPWPAFPSYLWSSSRLGIMAQAQLDSTDCAKDLIGTGPFKLREWVVNDHLTADKNPNYWAKDKDGNQLPYLDSITFKPVPDGQQRLNGLQSGQFQLIHTSSAIDIEQLRALAKQGTITDNESDKFAEVAHLMLCIAPPTDTVCPGSPFANQHARNAVALRPRPPDAQPRPRQGHPADRERTVRARRGRVPARTRASRSSTSTRPRTRSRPTRHDTGKDLDVHLRRHARP